MRWRGFVGKGQVQPQHSQSPEKGAPDTICGSARGLNPHLPGLLDNSDLGFRISLGI